MQRFLFSLIPFIGASLFADPSNGVASLAQNAAAVESPTEATCPPLNRPLLAPAYNAPAGVDTACGWDVFVDGTFLYYQADQDAMILAVTNPLGTPGEYMVVGSEMIAQGSKWAPGFKVGLGVNFDRDNWGGCLEYTWYHTNQTTSETAPNPPDGRLGMYQIFNYAGPNETTEFTSRWHLGMDILDATMFRAYYVGNRLVFNPFIGLRALWIDQSQKLDFNIVPVSTTNFWNASSDSWGIGPRFGVDLGWMLPAGFRFIGNAAGDICYTRFKLFCEEGANPILVTTDYAYTLRSTEKDLRAHVQMGTGIGWGRYFSSRQWHIDFAATYDFQVFWDQNGMSLPSNVSSGNELSGNLYLQGFSFKAILDF